MQFNFLHLLFDHSELSNNSSLGRNNISDSSQYPPSLEQVPHPLFCFSLGTDVNSTPKSMALLCFITDPQIGTFYVILKKLFVPQT